MSEPKGRIADRPEGDERSEEPARRAEGRGGDWTDERRAPARSEEGRSRVQAPGGEPEGRAGRSRVTAPGGEPESRAERLLRWYPVRWRERYGPEFTELLIAELAERPRCWRRTADVARGGLAARLAGAGLAGHPLDPVAAARAALATLACSVAGFLISGATMWAQLTVGWQWAPPATRATAVAMVVMSAAMALFAVLALLAVLPLAWATARAARNGGRRLLRGPVLLIIGPAAVLALGAHHVQNGWPGTGGHWWPQQGLVPGGVAAFDWACTLPVTSYWAHPAALAAFPPAELAWLVVCPAALAGLVTGMALLMRRVPMPPRVVRYEAWLAGVAGAGMAAFLAAALCWVAEGGPGPRGLFRTGIIDGAALAVMALALVTGWLALRQAVRAAALPPARPVR